MVPDRLSVPEGAHKGVLFAPVFFFLLSFHAFLWGLPSLWKESYKKESKYLSLSFLLEAKGPNVKAVLSQRNEVRIQAPHFLVVMLGLSFVICKMGILYNS